MTEQESPPEENPHPSWPHGDHLFSEWMTQDRTHQYRVCIHPKCKHVDVMELRD